MGKKKNQQLLKSGAITKSEFDRRERQAAASKGKKPQKSKRPKQQTPMTVSVPKKVFSTGDSGKNVINNAVATNMARKTQKKIMQDYLCCLVDNSNCESRFPDSQPRKTALFTSISTFDVPIIFGEANQGRFSIAVQPIMGDISDPTHYQAAIANVSTDGWDANDWSQASSYLSNINGRDPRVDINSQYLLSSGSQGYWISTVVTNPALAQPTTYGTGQNFTGSSVGAVTLYPDLGSLKVIQNTDGSLTVPAGQYSMNLEMKGTAVNALTMVLPYFHTEGANLIEQQVNTYAVTVAAGTNFSCSAQYFVSLPTSTKIYPTILKTSGNTSIAAGDLSALTTTVVITPAMIPSIPAPVNYGAIELIRPVAQTILTTYLGPTLLDGGRIAAAYLPRNMLESNYFTSTTSNDFGMLQNVENLANVRDAYDGRLEDGSYIWWSPYDPSDWTFQSVSEMNNAQWPSMVCSGVFTPGSTLASPTATNAMMRVRLLTTFEFITKSTAFEAEVECGSTASMDHVNMLLADQPHAMPNKTHKSWIARMFSVVGKFVRENRALLGALGAAGLALI